MRLCKVKLFKWKYNTVFSKHHLTNTSSNAINTVPELVGETLFKLWVLMVLSLIGVVLMHKLRNWKCRPQLLFEVYFRTFQRSKKS